MAKKYSKLHTNEKAATSHTLKIKNRGGTVIRKNTHAGIQLQYSFPEQNSDDHKEAVEFLSSYIKVPVKVSFSTESLIAKIKISANKWLSVTYKKHSGIFHNYHEVLQLLKSKARSEKLNLYTLFK